jgi:polar amino acid transport system substrate-binding protein
MKNTIINYIFIYLSFLNSFVCAEEIVLAADEWCPYNCTPNDIHPGFMVEIAKYAFEKSGHTVKYINVSWTRAIHGTRDGQYHGIIGTGKDETPDFVFPDIELGLASHTFYVMNDSQWRFDGLSSLERVTLGVIENYSHGTLYIDYIKQNEKNPERIQVINQDGGLKLNILKLLNNRLDVIVEDKTAFQYYLKTSNTKNKFLESGTYGNEKVYIAFSPKLKKSKEYADILTNAMNELRQTGKLNAILNNYGVTDWNNLLYK